MCKGFLIKELLIPFGSLTKALFEPKIRALFELRIKTLFGTMIKELFETMIKELVSIIKALLTELSS